MRAALPPVTSAAVFARNSLRRTETNFFAVTDENPLWHSDGLRPARPGRSLVGFVGGSGLRRAGCGRNVACGRVCLGRVGGHIRAQGFGELDEPALGIAKGARRGCGPWSPPAVDAAGASPASVPPPRRGGAPVPPGRMRPCRPRPQPPSGPETARSAPACARLPS